jgi:hypothetical protein
MRADEAFFMPETHIEPMAVLSRTADVSASCSERRLRAYSVEKLQAGAEHGKIGEQRSFHTGMGRK